jgi:hypothetical protein
MRNPKKYLYKNKFIMSIEVLKLMMKQIFYHLQKIVLLKLKERSLNKKQTIIVI